MRRLPFVVACLLLSSSASAAVIEPNGLPVPKASTDSSIQLNTFFSSRGETLDWIEDAASAPNAFSPLCGFTATFVLHGANCPLDFAWYNETGTLPAPEDLHVIIPAGSAVGTSFSG